MFAKYFIIIPLFIILTFGVNADQFEVDNPPINQGNISIEIHHCTSCGFRTKANMLAEEINREFGLNASLITGDIGSFDVYINGNLIFSKAEVGRLPNPDEIIQKIKEYKNSPEILSTQREQ